MNHVQRSSLVSLTVRNSLHCSELIFEDLELCLSLFLVSCFFSNLLDIIVIVNIIIIIILTSPLLPLLYRWFRTRMVYLD